jgi:salicylate 5-hydroxylase small subunit
VRPDHARLQHLYELLALYSDYALACDGAEWERWPDFFTEDGSYRLQPRENHEQGLPLCCWRWTARP